MKCFYHTDIEAVSTCSNCGKGICQTCSIDVSGRILCPNCLSLGNIPRYQPQPAQSSKPYNVLAIVSLVLGIFGFCTGILAIPAWVTGHLALKQLSEDPDQEGKQFAQAGRLLGMIVTAIYGIALLCWVGITIILAISQGV